MNDLSFHTKNKCWHKQEYFKASKTPTQAVAPVLNAIEWPTLGEDAVPLVTYMAMNCSTMAPVSTTAVTLHSCTDQNATFDDDDPSQSHHSTFVLCLTPASSSPFELLEVPILSSGEDATMPWLLSIAIKPQVSGEDLISFTHKLLLSSTVMILSIIVPMAQHLPVLLLSLIHI